MTKSFTFFASFLIFFPAVSSFANCSEGFAARSFAPIATADVRAKIVEYHQTQWNRRAELFRQNVQNSPFVWNQTGRPTLFQFAESSSKIEGYGLFSMMKSHLSPWIPDEIVDLPFLPSLTQQRLFEPGSNRFTEAAMLHETLLQITYFGRIGWVYRTIRKLPIAGAPPRGPEALFSHPMVLIEKILKSDRHRVDYLEPELRPNFHQPKRGPFTEVHLPRLLNDWGFVQIDVVDPTQLYPEGQLLFMNEYFKQILIPNREFGKRDQPIQLSTLATDQIRKLAQIVTSNEWDLGYFLVFDPRNHENTRLFGPRFETHDLSHQSVKDRVRRMIEESDRNPKGFRYPGQAVELVKNPLLGTWELQR